MTIKHQRGHLRCTKRKNGPQRGNCWAGIHRNDPTFSVLCSFQQQPVGRNLDIPNAAELQLALQINRDDFMIED